MNFEQRLIEISKSHGLNLQKAGDGFYLQLPSIQEHSGRLNIGPDEFEWYLTIENESTKLTYEDWIDYAGYSNDSKEKLIEDKVKDIEYFLKNWLDAKAIKIETEAVFFGAIKNKKAYWKISNIWSKVVLTDLM